MQPLIVVHDTLPPVVTMTVPSTVPVRFTVAWSGGDNLSGLREYDIQYKEGPMGQWQNWLTDTLALEAQFIGIPDATYYFQVKATDNKIIVNSEW